MKDPNCWCVLLPAPPAPGLGNALCGACTAPMRKEIADLHHQIEGHCARIAAQSELLSQRAETQE